LLAKQRIGAICLVLTLETTIIGSWYHSPNLHSTSSPNYLFQLPFYAEDFATIPAHIYSLSLSRVK
jgi:hypothetical protein